MTKEQICKATWRWASRKADALFADKDLCGLCLICSCVIDEAFKHFNYNSKIVVLCGEWCSHAYVLSNEKVYDVTARQFKKKGFPEIVIMNEEDYLRQLEMDGGFRYFKDVHEARAHTSEWPMYQYPACDKVEDGVNYVLTKGVSGV